MRNHSIAISLVAYALGLTILIHVVENHHSIRDARIIHTMFFAGAIISAFVSLALSRRLWPARVASGFIVFYSYFRLARAADLTGGVLWLIAVSAVLIIASLSMLRSLDE